MDLCSIKTRSGKSRDYRDVIVFGKLRFQNVLRLYEDKKPAFLNSCGLKSLFEELRFRDGFIWTRGLTAGLTVEIKLRFQIPRV